MKKIYALFPVLFMIFFAQAQTTLISASDGGFESGTTFAANGWTVVNDATNTWNLGTVPAWFTGSRGAYVSNTGGTAWTYTNSVNQRSHFYRDINFPAGETVIKLDFDIRSYGETNWDNLSVYIADPSVTPTNAGPVGTATTVTGWPGYTNGSTGYFLLQYNGGAVPTTTTHVTYTFTAAQATYATGNTKRLIFTWKNDNSFGTNPPASVDNIALTSSCSGPTLAATTAITQSGATLNWAAIAGATGYNVQYRVAGATTWTNAAGNPYPSNTAVITGLLSGTNYEFQVAAVGPVCNAYSSTGTFATLCGTSALPWTEGFEGVNPVGSNIFPNCWARELITGNSPGTYGTNDTYREPHTGSKLLYTQYSGTAWVYTPGFAVTAGVAYRFSFWMKNKMLTSPVDFVMDVKYGNAQASASMTSTLQAGYTASNANWQQFTYIFTPTTTGTIYMGIKSTSTTFTPWYLSFDDFKMEVAPTCTEPINITTSAITFNTATISWSPGAIGTAANGYDYYVSTSPTTPANTATPTGSTAAGVTTANLTGLVANTVYYVWVRSKCSATDISDWSGVVSFTTPCQPLFTLSWAENFDGLTTVGANTYPPCWKKENGDWQSATAATNTYNDPRSAPNYITDTYSATNEFIWTPAFQLSAGVAYNFSFWFAGDGYTGWTGDVFYNTSQVSTGATQMGGSFITPTTTSSATYAQVNRAFTPTTSGVYYFAVRVNASITPWYLGFDDFKLDQTTPCPLATTAISYGAPAYCTTSATATPTITGTTGGTFTSTTGLTLDANTGVITPATSTPGNYVVTYTVTGAGACGNTVRTANVTITAQPTGTFSYAGSPYCSTVSSAAPTSTLSNSGTFSAPAGLSINSTTGVVNPSASTAGTYTVTNTVAAAGGCPVYTTTATITITAMPTASFNYGTAPVCMSSTSAPVNFTGTTGGVYSSTTGLTLNTATGEINPSTSTAGTYTVTYTVAAAGGCAQYSTTASVTINSLSVAPTAATASNPNICGTSGTTDLSVTGGTLGSGASYTWYADACGGSPIGTGATLTGVTVYTTTTFYARIEGICNTTSCVSVTVNVNPVPAVVLTAAQNSAINPFSNSVLLATVSPAGNYTYQFTKDGVVLTNNTTSPLIPLTPDSVGTYVVTVTNTATGCTATSNSVVISAAPSNNIFISPNPNNGQFKVRYYAAASEFGSNRSINVYDNKGARVAGKQITVTSAYTITDMDISKYSRGVYTVSVSDASGKILASGQIMVVP